MSQQQQEEAFYSSPSPPPQQQQPSQRSEDIVCDAQPLLNEEADSACSEPPKAKNKERQPARRREFSSGFPAKLAKLTALRPVRVEFGTKRNFAFARLDYSALGYEDSMEFQNGCNDLALTDKTVKSLHYEDNVAVFEAGVNNRWIV